MASLRFPGGRVAVTSPDIASLQLVDPLPAWARVYVLPWLVAYPLAYHAFYNRYEDWITSIGELLAARSLFHEGVVILLRAKADWTALQSGLSSSASSCSADMRSRSSSRAGACGSGPGEKLAMSVLLFLCTGRGVY